ncbi:unnamed protein product [Lepeophtheirus salmonis]|uniref:(salmon louse) hypothetical protein n=1 Tax=Lepeophtheirus salmonis TaxID=72036 RepID=A0A7R8CF93_LEPSM|nr:unnamed protein product [Lepeophtheirus salmonis]CAF2797990.1 unnamed protein product [Lepeophtheirus salmonis]
MVSKDDCGIPNRDSEGSSSGPLINKEGYVENVATSSTLGMNPTSDNQGEEESNSNEKSTIQIASVSSLSTTTTTEDKIKEEYEVLEVDKDTDGSISMVVCRHKFKYLLYYKFTGLSIIFRRNLNDGGNTSRVSSVPSQSKTTETVATSTLINDNEDASIFTIFPRINNRKISRCQVCSEEIKDNFKTLFWETMIFCNERCLGKYQSLLNSSSSFRKTFNLTSIRHYFFVPVKRKSLRRIMKRINKIKSKSMSKITPLQSDLLPPSKTVNIIKDGISHSDQTKVLEGCNNTLEEMSVSPNNKLDQVQNSEEVITSENTIVSLEEHIDESSTIDNSLKRTHSSSPEGDEKEGRKGTRRSS